MGAKFFCTNPDEKYYSLNLKTEFFPFVCFLVQTPLQLPLATSNTKVGVLANKINDSTSETVTAADNDRERLMKSAPQFVETAKLRP